MVYFAYPNFPDWRKMMPSRLRSKWEILEFDSSEFYKVTSLLNLLRAALGDNVKEEKISDDLINRSMGTLRSLQFSLKMLDARVTEATAKRLVEECENKQITYKRFTSLASEIDSRIRDELEMVKMYVLEPRKAEYFEPESPLFGEAVATNFPSLGGEIAEAAKCYALDRGTACAFHSLRCLEAGIRAMSRFMSIPDPIKGSERNWGVALGLIKKGYETKWPTSASRMSGDGELFERLHGALVGMQNPYRNATMHLDKNYAPDEALHLFELVKGIMKPIAARMDEDGKSVI